MAMIQDGNKFNIKLFTESRHVNSPSAARSLLVSIDFIQVSQVVTFFFWYYMPSPSKKSLIRKLIHLLVFFKKYYFAILNYSYCGKYHETLQNWKIFNLASLGKKYSEYGRFSRKASLYLIRKLFSYFTHCYLLNIIISKWQPNNYAVAQQ